MADIQKIAGMIKTSEQKFDSYEMETLPANLKRNSLLHYYLSVYPSIGGSRSLPQKSPFGFHPNAFSASF